MSFANSFTIGLEDGETGPNSRKRAFSPIEWGRPGSEPESDDEVEGTYY